MPSTIGKCKLFSIKHITLLEGEAFLRNKHKITFFLIKCTFYGRKENTINLILPLIMPKKLKKKIKKKIIIPNRPMICPFFRRYFTIIINFLIKTTTTTTTTKTK